MFASGKAASASAANYIEDVFSTYLYAGTSASQTITNNIDLSTKGGLVWLKNRTSAVGHKLFSPATGMTYAAAYELETNLADGFQGPRTNTIRADTTGFSLGTASNFSAYNLTGQNYVSWTFREQPKFFDVVTFTTDGSGGATFSHLLGSTPACMFVKSTGSVGGWYVYHTSLGVSQYLQLNSTAAAATSTNFFTVSSTSVTIAANGALPNSTACVAYLFASNAGGFGLTGTDNVISCGSFTTDSGGNFSVSLGYEPQLVIVKRTDATQNWFIADTMRGFSQTQFNTLNPNLTAAETANNSNYIAPNATGFASIGNQFLSGSASYIYIAIRRGPMKVPTSGTSVFSPIAANNAQGTQNTTGFPVDLQLQAWRDGVNSKIAVDRLRGVSTNATNGEKYLVTDTTAAEVSGTSLTQYWNNTGFQTASGWASFSNVYWNFGRAPSFFDEVCYTGTGTTSQTINHNLGVTPELVINKSRTGTARNWTVNYGNTLSLRLNLTNAGSTDTSINLTSTTFDALLGSGAGWNASGVTYVTYLFATCAGVSKVGSYTGTGTTKQVDCGFTGGARFVLIKRTDSTGDWYVWDSARGIVAGNDPYLLLNSTAAEVTSTDYIDTYSAGFEISSTAPAAINASGGTFIFLAIA